MATFCYLQFFPFPYHAEGLLLFFVFPFYQIFAAFFVFGKIAPATGAGESSCCCSHRSN